MIKIVEVGPRDGLQNETRPLSVADRCILVRKLVSAGLKHVEVGAFVSPQWVPQMKNSDQVIKAVRRQRAHLSALVPNEYGMKEALAVGLKEVAIFGACSESFSKKNINCSIAESFRRFAKVMEMAQANKVRVRGYLSTVFGCPYEGKVSPKKAVSLIHRMHELGVYEISVGDTIGVATPKQVNIFLKQLKPLIRQRRIAMHFHDTRGTALANVLESLRAGVTTFDASVGGLGGCPYAKGASGNLATEDLVYMLEGMGLKTGVHLKRLLAIKPWLESKIKRPLPSRMGQAGLPKNW